MSNAPANVHQALYIPAQQIEALNQAIKRQVQAARQAFTNQVADMCTQMEAQLLATTSEMMKVPVYNAQRNIEYIPVSQVRLDVNGLDANGLPIPPVINRNAFSNRIRGGAGYPDTLVSDLTDANTFANLISLVGSDPAGALTQLNLIHQQVIQPMETAQIGQLEPRLNYINKVKAQCDAFVTQKFQPEAVLVVIGDIRRILQLAANRIYGAQTKYTANHSVTQAAPVQDFTDREHFNNNQRSEMDFDVEQSYLSGQGSGNTKFLFQEFLRKREFEE